MYSSLYVKANVKQFLKLLNFLNTHTMYICTEYL
jgi:hypothetical protein